MVSFQCESCGDVLTKKKLDPHRSRCRGATFSCIDCMVHFNGNEYRSHTSCMTEDQKYQGALYKNKNKKVKLNPPTHSEHQASASFQTPNMAAAVQHHHFSHASYVEDVPEDVHNYLVPDDGDNSDSDDDHPPHAPTPPPAHETPVNVFDFMVASTPNASNMHLAPGSGAGAGGPAVHLSDSTQMVPYGYDANDAAAAAGELGIKHDSNSHAPMVPYGAASGTPFRTPAPGERRRKDDKDAKTDKKRKRLTLDIHDQVMTDAPPVLHSGLTGGLNRLTTRPSSAAFPPSPESGETPASPLKKTKHIKHHSRTSRSETIGNSIFSVLTSKAAKPKKRKSHRSASPSSTTKKHHKHHKHSHSHSHREKGDKDKTDKDKTEKGAPVQKLLEYPKKEEESNNGQMIVYKPRADLFLSFVNKGPDSERGCSMNKALKRFHRERSASAGSGQVNKSKQVEEKELFRSLRLRKNDRGEIVLFCVDE